jgi:Nif-specific regulatory protein
MSLEIAILTALNLSAMGEASTALTQLRTSLEHLTDFSPYDMQLLGALASVQIIVRAKRLNGSTEQDLERSIARTRQRRNLWHLTWGLLIRAELLIALSRGAEAESGLREAIGIARKNADRSMTWKAHYWLGRVYEQGLRYEQALRAYRVAALTIWEIAADIDVPRWKKSYLNQAEVSDALSRHARLKGEVGRRARRDVARLNRNEMISRKMLASLSAIGQQLSSILEMDKLLANILDLSIDNVGAERGVIFLLEEAGESMTPASARGVGGQDLEDLSSFSRSVLAQAAQGKTILTVDVGQDPALANHPSLVIHAIKSILCVPMRHRGRVLGVLYLDTRKAHQLFTDKERSFVESFASQAAIAIENARLFGEMRAENHRLHEEVESRFRELVGTSASMRRLGDTIGGILNVDCTVLLTGESGTGKEVVARVIHYNSPRRKAPFVAIDCGALPENLLEAELFGCRRGAFTGADRDRIGLIEAANGGTLFLDEITNTSIALQARLLRVLQEREVRRLGENNTRKVDVRFLAATNADIESLIRDGRFRQDLYYRLNVVAISIPPLRDRLEDIPLLVEHILSRRASHGQARARLGPGVLRLLTRHRWPGNVRELENVLERACALSVGGLVAVSALPDALRFGDAGESTGDGRPSMAPAGAHAPKSASGKTGEQAMIEEALRRSGGDKAKAARYIGWNRQKLYRRMKAYAIAKKFGRAA